MNRTFAKICIVLLAFLLSSAAIAQQSRATRPNIVLIMTDDQGYGDLGVHGNPAIRTPNLDRLARESIRFEPFYVSPVCAPTRASLMTGRYNYRTGVVDTYLGRAMMHPDEVTVAELLRETGYRTGIFGKWHLGDNYPLRAMDQGFEESLVHKGGGIKQPSDPWYGTDYFDPVLYHNGQPIKTTGYCSDVYTTAAIGYIEAHQHEPFFIYLAYNAPHTPLHVADELADHYRRQDLAETAQQQHTDGANFDADAVAKVYGMVENIDDNAGRLLARLDALNLRDNTIVIFMTDNGHQQPRFAAGLRGRKTTVFEGGIRVPFFLRWPARFSDTRTVTTPAAHIDILPTLLAACGLNLPDGVHIDGKNLLPVIDGETPGWAGRPLVFQWHRGDTPQPGRAFAIRKGGFKLLQPRGTWAGDTYDPNAALLFNLRDDPAEQVDLAAQHAATVRELRAAYDAWFADVSATRGYDPVRIAVGTPHENPVVLTRQDWRGPEAGWTANAIGHWELTIARPGPYSITVRFPPLSTSAEVSLTAGNHRATVPAAAGARHVTFDSVTIDRGPARLSATVDDGDTASGPQYVELHLTE